MNDREKRKNNNFFLKNHRLLNIWSLFLIYVLVIYVICIKKHSNIFTGYILPSLVSLLIAILLFLLIDYLISKYTKKRNRKIALKALKESGDEGPITVLKESVFLKEKKLTKEQYDCLVNIRITNGLSITIIALLIVLIVIDFKGTLVRDIILPIIMILGSLGILGTLLDIIFEGLIRLFYRKQSKTKIKVKEMRKPNFLTKNKRIYYIPIMVIIGIILIMIIVDFTKTDKLYSRIVFPLELITILDMILIVIIDNIITKVKSVRNIIVDNKTLDLNENIMTLVEKELNDK